MSENGLHRETYASVKIDHLKHNIRVLKKISGKKFFCPMVKSNAYGHGDKKVVQALIDENVTTVGVALIEEAERLRNYGFNAIDILVFGAIKSKAVDFIINKKITPVISQWYELELFKKKNIKNFPIHIKFNTGMNRLGFQPSDAQKLIEYFKLNQQLEVKGVCTHFACGEDFGIANGVSEKQFKKFKELLTYFPGVTAHAYNTSAFFSCLDKGIDMSDIGARPGGAIYGCYPSIKDQKLNLVDIAKLKPVMELKSEVIAYQLVEKGDRVSYGGTWVAEKPSVIGVVPIGYTDGYSRDYSGRGVMLYRGAEVPVIGRVCMDYTMVDLTSVLGNESGQPGEEIVLLGRQGDQEINLSYFAKKVNKIPYEIITTIGRRVPRKYLSN